MNHLVILDARAGELEKILSGIKTMLIKESGPAESSADSVHPGDHLYFLRDPKDGVVRVKATVVRVVFVSRLGEGSQRAEDLPHILKEMQPRLQLTEDQYNFWAQKSSALLVEFGSAHKIALFQVDPNTTQDRSGWVSF